LLAVVGVDVERRDSRRQSKSRIQVDEEVDEARPVDLDIGAGVGQACRTARSFTSTVAGLAPDARR